MADQIYNASLIEALWEKIVPGGCVLIVNFQRFSTPYPEVA